MTDTSSPSDAAGPPEDSPTPAVTAIRHLGTQYPYDDFEGDRVSLRSDPDTVAATLHAGS